MPQLTPNELDSRRALDYRTVVGLSREAIGGIAAYACIRDIKDRREVTVAEGEAGRATVYVVEYCFPHLVDRERTATTALAVFDLSAGGNYPFTPPLGAFISRPFPWSPHVHPGSGNICLGPAWPAAGGRMLFAHAVVHVMRLVNFDEPRTSPDGGWNASADAYWQTTLRRKPYLPDLRYPRLPTEITHGLSDENDVFRPATDEFGPAGSNDFDPDGMFRPAGR